MEGNLIVSSPTEEVAERALAQLKKMIRGESKPSKKDPAGPGVKPFKEVEQSARGFERKRRSTRDSGQQPANEAAPTQWPSEERPFEKMLQPACDSKLQATGATIPLNELAHFVFTEGSDCSRESCVGSIKSYPNVTLLPQMNGARSNYKRRSVAVHWATEEAYELTSRNVLKGRGTGPIMFQILHSGRFRKNLPDTLADSHSSVAIMAELAPTFGRLQKVAPGLVADCPLEGGFLVWELGEEDGQDRWPDEVVFLADTVTLSVEHAHPAFVHTESGGYIPNPVPHSHDCTVSLVFGYGLKMPGASPERIKGYKYGLRNFFKQQYLRVLSAAVRAKDIEIICLQALADPSNGPLFKQSIKGLAAALNEIPARYSLPEVHLLVPFKAEGFIKSLSHRCCFSLQKKLKGALIRFRMLHT